LIPVGVEGGEIPAERRSSLVSQWPLSRGRMISKRFPRYQQP
jgi:hypothetical protein